MEKNNNIKNRLFLDMDGMLAEYRTFESEEQYLQKGYYISLKPHMNVIEAIKKIITTEPNIDVYVLSAYFDVPGAIAVKEKNDWLNKYLPEVDMEHRIYTVCGQPKQKFIPNGIGKNDYLMDDYSKNLTMWEDGGGIGIKLLNGINGRIGTWDGAMVSYKKSADDIANSIVNIIHNREMIRDTIDECQLRNEKQGLTMYISKDRLTQIVEKYFPEYNNVDDFRKNFTLEHWRFVQRIEPTAEIRENTSIKQFEFEHKTFQDKLEDKMEILLRSATERQIESLKNGMKLRLILQNLRSKHQVIAPTVNALEKNGLTNIVKDIKVDEKETIREKIKTTENAEKEAHSQWSEYLESTIEEMKASVENFFEKYRHLSVENRKAFLNNLENIKTTALTSVNDLHTVIKDMDKEAENTHNRLLDDAKFELDVAFLPPKEDVIKTTNSLVDEIFADEVSMPTVAESHSKSEIEEIL